MVWEKYIKIRFFSLLQLSGADLSCSPFAIKAKDWRKGYLFFSGWKIFCLLMFSSTLGILLHISEITIFCEWEAHISLSAFHIIHPTPQFIHFAFHLKRLLSILLRIPHCRLWFVHQCSLVSIVYSSISRYIHEMLDHLQISIIWITCLEVAKNSFCATQSRHLPNPKWWWWKLA